MAFNSISFLLFFPVFIILYYLFPIKWRHYILLISGYYFYACLNPDFLLYLFPITFLTYLAGLGIDCVSQTILKKLLVVLGCLSTMGVLLVLKFTSFMLPIGISFFSFQALGYLIDVYRKKVHAERNIVKYALFVS